jgi:hypothetical protein
MKLLLSLCTVCLCALNIAWAGTDSAVPSSFSYPKLSEVGSPLPELRPAGMKIWELDSNLVTRYSELTNGERMLVQGWQVNGNLHSTPTYTLNRFKGFYRSQGRFPTDGFELASWNNGLGLGHLEWSSLSTDDQLNWMAVGISPVTGTFFPTFTQDTWTPGGLFFQQFTSKEQLDRFYKDHPKQIRVGSWHMATEVWLLKSFGDTEGEVLMEVPIYFVTDSSAERLTQPLITR